MRRVALLVILLPLIVSMFNFAVNIDLATADAILELEMTLSKDVFAIGEEINITLTLINTGDENITITYGPPFYDLSYCTESECYRWSDGKVFMLIVLDLVLEPGENYTETLQWNLYQYRQPDYYPPEPGTYTLNGVCHWIGLSVSAIVRIFNPALHIVPDDFATIQEAINNANEGDTVFVRNGTYYENVVANKSISLIGENKDITIIDGNEIITPIVHITANSVTVKAFTIQNGGRIYGWEGGGIYLTNSNGNNIINNMITNTQYGINLNSTDNTIIGNTIIENDVGIQFLGDYSNNNTIYHNNLIDNGWQVNSFTPSNNTWDNGFEGNYWGDYNGTDLGGDGIGDTPYVIDGNNTDNYPLMNPYIEGDVNHDGIVELADFWIVSQAFGSTPLDPNWNPHADLNEDGVVELMDFFIISENFGKFWWIFT